MSNINITDEEIIEYINRATDLPVEKIKEYIYSPHPQIRNILRDRATRGIIAAREAEKAEAEYRMMYESSDSETKRILDEFEKRSKALDDCLASRREHTSFDEKSERRRDRNTSFYRRNKRKK